MTNWLTRLFGKVRIRRSRAGLEPLRGDGSAGFDASATIRLEDEAGQALGRTRLRLGFIGILVGAGFLVAAGRAVELAVTGEFAEAAPVRVAQVASRRGEIVDRNGQILASNLDFHSVFADPRQVWDPVETAQALRTVLPHLNAETLQRDLSSNRRFVWIERGLGPRERQAIHMLGLPGIGFRVEPGRVYPRRRLAAHLVGFTDQDLAGLAGAERAFNDELNDGSGRPVSLSIHLGAQDALETVLRERMERYSAQGAMAVLMRVGTGEIIALASLPDFDPNRAGSEPAENRFNRTVQGVYELGSVFKPLTLAAGIEAGLVRLDDTFDARAPIAIGSHRIRDFRPQSRILTAREVIIHSSNIGSARMAERIGGEVLTSFFGELGLWERPPLEIIEGQNPMLPARWGRAEVMTASYGHGFNVSPVALAAAYAALANDGIYTPPTLRPVGPTDIVPQVPVMSSATAAQVLGVMRAAVAGGQADREGLAIAGKTGTAQRIVNGRYQVGNVLTSFVGIFPFDDPQYVLVVSLDQPRPIRETHGFNTAGWNAAPTGGEIIERVAPVLGVGLREADPGARVQTVARMFVPRTPVRAGPEEPVELAAGRDRP
ncbi:peptidoglycan glycosyltransferase [Glycocaulis alkaliphilus]|uniref:Peptidoglycan glycosyltransferase n=1 Tax=Glycocaulis alkaliphilus TaxID=1434191 RepID=A0A3T0E711_9PROT|nr:penicillin-binding protein 2 [Glycocaulis alkaliphilus]AZU03205.1 peptidoglycan glycosyltransferase [Glycocaulis alkaliphilus]GGB71769.1 peptidoglycan synthase FtsI [Glycocaulis alkaliphilus]